jgi:thioesterase-3
VNNARYLEFYEESRWDFLAPAAKDKFFERLNLIFVVVNINVSYKKPLIPNQVVALTVKDLKYNNKSIVMTQEITDAESQVICSKAEVSFVLLDKDSGRPADIDETIQNKFNELKKLDL